MVAGLKIDMKALNHELARRQMGYGRGGRMTIEKDTAHIVSGVRFGETIGGPIALTIVNKDFKINTLPVVHRPRPGHADLVGALKYNRADVRDILERASARETTARTAIGGICKQFLKAFRVDILSHVVELGGVKADTSTLSFNQIRTRSEKSGVRCADAAASQKMIQTIDEIKKTKDTIGGVFEVQISGLPPGIGSFTTGPERIESRLAACILSIQAVKGVEFGMGFDVARTPGSRVHDEIYYDKAKKKFYRKTNNAGGIEGGMTTGDTIVLRACTKPYATLMKPLRSVNIKTKQTEVATIERSDVTAVPACGVVGEAMAAIEIAKALLEKFGGDSLGETLRNYRGYLAQLKTF
jgi:chorismate synthase